MRAALAVLILLLLPPLEAAEITIDGKRTSYQPEPGTIEIKHANGTLRGTVFYTAYNREGIRKKQLKKRPVVFCFNGGPGSSSAWLHLGAFGPRRLVLGEGGLTRPEIPYRAVDNQHSLLDVADLVFVDPIGTGYSRGADPLSTQGFFGFKADVKAMAEFIGLYLDQAKRRTSPIILVGESYGSMRVCGLAPELEEAHGIVVSGLVLISGPIVMGKRQAPDLLMPTAAASAHYHGALGEEIQKKSRTELLAEIDHFTKDTYLPALDGDRTKRSAAIVGLLKYTTLRRRRSLNFQLNEVRVNLTKKLGAEQLGRYDMRVRSDERRGLFRGSVGDPTMDIITEPMQMVIEDYLKEELGHPDDGDYKLIRRIPLWSHAGSQASQNLTRAFATNRGLRIFVACGYYDCVTPMGVVRDEVLSAKMTPAQRDSIRFENYEGGHMMYTNLPALEKLSNHLRTFIRQSAKRKLRPALVPVLSRSETVTLSPYRQKDTHRKQAYRGGLRNRTRYNSNSWLSFVSPTKNRNTLRILSRADLNPSEMRLPISFKLNTEEIIPSHKPAKADEITRNNTVDHDRRRISPERSIVWIGTNKTISSNVQRQIRTSFEY